KKPVCPMTRSLHPPMAHCRQRVRFAATWREEFFEVPFSQLDDAIAHRIPTGAVSAHYWALASSKSGRPSFVKLHREPHRNAAGRVVFLLEQILIRGLNTLVCVRRLLRHIPLGSIALSHLLECSEHLIEYLFRMRPFPYQRGDDRANRVVNTRAV